MKRILASLLTVVVLMVTVIIPGRVLAAAPTEEDWEFTSYSNHACYAYFTINTVNLQVDSFTIVNTTNNPMEILVRREIGGTTELIFSLISTGVGTVSAPINNFKFHRIPLDDPDNPGSIQYPPNVSIGTRYG